MIPEASDTPALPPGVSREADGRLIARVQVGRARPIKRFPAETDPAVAAAWIATTQRALRDQRAAYGEAPIVAHRPAPAGHATLDADVARYLPQIAGRPSTKADTSHLRAWLAVVLDGVRLGLRRRAAITTELVNLAIAQWRTMPTAHTVRRVRVAAYDRDGHLMPAYERTAPATSGAVVAVRTIRHRCRVLADLYHALDGKRAPTPVDEAKIPKLPKDHPIGIDVSIVLDVARRLALATVARPRQRAPHDPEAYAAREAARRQDRQRTYARYVVLVTTGQRPCQVMRAQPDDLDLAAGVWVVRSAKLEPAHTITLTADMRQAWQAFIEADAWGAYDTTTHANRVHAAGWPRGLRPYNARHAVMIDALAAGVDLGDVQGLAGHTSPLTTRRFYGPLLVGRQREVSQKLEGRLKDLFAPRLVKK
jgi:integrase